MYVFYDTFMQIITQNHPRALPLTVEVINDAAKTYLNMENYVQITLFPEKEKQ